MPGSLSTFYEITAEQQVGDFVGLSFNVPVEVKNIRIALAAPSGPKNFIFEGIMEYTLDGKSWVAFDQNIQPDSRIGEDVCFCVDGLYHTWLLESPSVIFDCSPEYTVHPSVVLKEASYFSPTIGLLPPSSPSTL